jgi:tricorn protease-like protein
MKKKIRVIIVDGVEYAWKYVPNCDKYEGGGRLKIWQNKKEIFHKWVECDEIITPKRVAEIIGDLEYHDSILGGK